MECRVWEIGLGVYRVDDHSDCQESVIAKYIDNFYKFKKKKIVRNPSESGSFDEFGSLINFCKSPSFSIPFFSFPFLLLIAKL